MPRKKDIPEIECHRPTAVLAVEAPKMKLYASIAKNDAAEAFAKLCAPLAVELKDDGCFSKKGTLPKSIPFTANDIETEPGDVILTDENTVAVCYGKKAVKAVRIGEKTYKSKEQILKIFGEGDVNVRFYLEWSE